MFGVIMGLIGVLCLLLYFGMTAVEVLIKYSILALRFIFWFIPLWIKAAAIFFYGWGWLLYHLTGNKQLLRQIRESEKMKNAYDYEQKQAWQRQQDEFKLLIPVEKYPYANRELFGNLAVCIHRKEYDKLPMLENEIKESHFSNISFANLPSEGNQNKMYGYDDVKDLLPIEPYKDCQVTCYIREINGIFVILAQKGWTGAKFLWHTDKFYEALEAMPLALEYIKLYCGTKVESIWLDMEELNERLIKLREKKKLYTYEEIKDLPPIITKVYKRDGVTADIRKINNRYLIVAVKEAHNARMLIQTDDYEKAMKALPQMPYVLATRYTEMKQATWLYLDDRTKRVIFSPPNEMLIDNDD